MVVLQVPSQQVELNQVAIFYDTQNQPLRLITNRADTGYLTIKPINAKAIAVDNKAFELWMLPAFGNPTSLGLMPVTGKPQEVILSPQILNILQSTDGLAISVEPLSGSPTSLPTGPVIYRAPIVAL